MAMLYPNIFVLPVYHVDQLDNARRTATLAAEHGFKPIIVCNSAGTAQALVNDPYAVSVGRNTGYGGAATFAAATNDFDTLVLCNDDLRFTKAGMQALQSAVGQITASDQATIMGFLPRVRPRIAQLPRILGVVARVSGLSVLTRQDERSIGGPVSFTSDRDDNVRALPAGVGFPFVCVAITRAAWNGLGGFDPHFPLYFEDTDLLRRAHRSGTIQVQVALGECIHAHSASARTVLPYILPLMSVGARNYLEFHQRVPRTLAVALVTTGLLIRASCWLPIRPNRGTEVRAILLSLGAVLFRRPTPMPPWS